MPKLSFWTKVAYGSGDLSAAIVTSISSFFLLFFFTNAAGLDPGAAGLVLLIGKVWDAVNDPLIGLWSDRTQSKWGRRLPWMTYGAIPFGLTFFLQWLIPTSDRTWLFWYYVVIAILFNTFYTVVNLPYTALTAELTQDYQERTSLNSFRFAFSIGGSVLGLIIAQGIFAWVNPSQGNSCDQQGYDLLAIACSLIAVISIYGCVYGIRDRVLLVERQREQTLAVQLPLVQQFAIAFANRAFLCVIGIYFCSWLAIQITASILPYFVTDWMGLKTTDFIQLTLVIQITALVMLFVWGAIASRIGKKAVYVFGIGFWLVAQVGLVGLQPGQVGLMYGLAVLAGFGIAVAYLIPWAMVPDVIDLDQLQTGQRREGIFYGCMVFLQKIGLALGLFGLGQMLKWSGFLEQASCQANAQTILVQPESALTAIRLAIGPVPAILLLASLGSAYLYPISREFHQQILQRLAEKS
ncbi:MAG: MFS transporter [Pseudanabaenaceae cyanobacterium bins.68]|nr:MFS transporter [Pseudanabaenaceae cyanobacterium bins.68]